MSIPVSTIPAARAYLFTTVAARSELATVMVSYDDPGRNRPKRDLIVIGDVRRVPAILALVGGGGAGWIEETYQIDVTVRCNRTGRAGQEGYETASSLADVVVDVVRLDPSLGGLVTEAKPGVAEYRTEWDDKGVGQFVEVVFTVDVYAQI